MFNRFASALFVLALAGSASADLAESDFWKPEVEAGNLLPVAKRIPTSPKVVDLEGKDRLIGRQGGTLRTLVTRTKDVRQMVVYGYSRLVGYDENYEIKPDILLGLENEGNRKFTLRLRPGHRWSDGHPFTSEDFRYWWEDVANNPDLSPSGPLEFLRVEGELPIVTIPDETTVVYEWSRPNPRFVQELAEARPPFIYRPAHFLKKLHSKYADEDSLRAALREKTPRPVFCLYATRFTTASTRQAPNCPMLTWSK